jgi:uncharacterized protein (TIGR02217 family)
MSEVFTDVIFPECLSYGSVFQPTYSVDKVAVASGAESRRTKQAYVKYRYEISLENQNADEIAEVLNIFHVCNGSLSAFMFKDLVDNTSAITATSISAETIDGNDQPQGTYDGNITYYPLLKTYTYASRTQLRRIRFPDVPTLLINVNGTPNVDWAWDTTEQAFYWPSNNPTNGDVITAGYNFLVPVRFDTESLGIEPVHGLYDSLIGSLTNIDLVEVFE